MIKRMCVSYFTYFNLVRRIFHKNIRYFYDKAKGRYFKRFFDKEFKLYLAYCDFAHDRAFSADALNFISRFYRLGRRDVFKNRLAAFRSFSLRTHFERAATK